MGNPLDFGVTPVHSWGLQSSISAGRFYVRRYLLPVEEAGK